MVDGFIGFNPQRGRSSLEPGSSAEQPLGAPQFPVVCSEHGPISPLVSLFPSSGPVNRTRVLSCKENSSPPATPPWERKEQLQGIFLLDKTPANLSNTEGLGAQIGAV